MALSTEEKRAIVDSFARAGVTLAAEPRFDEVDAGGAPLYPWLEARLLRRLLHHAGSAAAGVVAVLRNFDAP